jgi:hypothetical protein
VRTWKYNQFAADERDMIINKSGSRTKIEGNNRHHPLSGWMEIPTVECKLEESIDSV